MGVSSLQSEFGSALNHHQALSEAGVRTARFGERSQYEGSRAPASPSAVFKATIIPACRKN